MLTLFTFGLFQRTVFSVTEQHIALLRAYHEEQLSAPAGEMKHQHITQNFVNAILSGEELIAPGLDGIHEVMLANAIYLSAWTEQTVTLPADPEQFNRILQAKIEGRERR